MERETFGQFIKRLREARTLSINQAANVGGLSNKKWQEVEHDKGLDGLTNLTLRKLARGVGVDPQEVFEKAGRPYAEPPNGISPSENPFAGVEETLRQYGQRLDALEKQVRGIVGGRAPRRRGKRAG